MTPPADERLPSVTDVVTGFRAHLRDADRRRADGLAGLLMELHETNLAQWVCEDSVRSTGGDDATVASAKREIDGLNARRHQMVEAIDAAIDQSVSQVLSATPSTESPGMVFDRLSVLVIRIHHTERAAAAPGSDTADYGARLPVLDGQLAVLQEALDVLLKEIGEGRRRFVPYQSLKLYAQ